MDPVWDGALHARLTMLAMGVRAAVATVLAIGLAGPAEAGRRANMPDGWRWPPTREMRRDGKQCLADLRAMGVRFERARRKRRIATPVLVPDMRFGPLLLAPTFRKPPFVMDCRLARGLAQHAELLVGLGVSELRFSTIHEYRQVRLGGKKRRMLSRHALGLAMDIFEIVTDSGDRVVVKDRYRKRDATLLALERSILASMDFRTPLTPGNDRSHRDHFHIEARVDFLEDRSITAMLAR